MQDRLTDRIRALVRQRYIEPARQEGRTRVAVRVKDVKAEMSQMESMRGKSVVICQALQSKKMLKDNGLDVESVDGPPSKKSPTVVVHYRVVPRGGVDALKVPVETPSQRAFRLTESIRGILKDEIAAFGGTEAFMRWVRSDEEDVA